MTGETNGLFMNRHTHDGLQLLKENSVFWSKLGCCYDPPRKGPDGKYILFASDFDRL